MTKLSWALVLACVLLAPIQSNFAPISIQGVPYRTQDLLVVGTIATACIATRLGGISRDGLLAGAAGIVGIAVSVIFARHTGLAVVAGSRLALGVLLALCSAALCLQDRRRIEWVVRALGAAGALSAVLGLLFLWRQDLPTGVFLGQPTNLAFMQRLTLPFSHANVAGTFLGATSLASGWLGFNHIHRDERRLGTAWLAAAWLQAVGVVLSASRGALFGIAVVLAFGWLLSRQHRPLLTLQTAVLLTAAACCLLFSDVARFRYLPGARQSFTDVRIDAPSSIDPSAALEIDVRNETPRPIGGPDTFLVARWEAAATDELVTLERWDLPATQPEEVVTVPVVFEAPVAPGEYRIRWDVLVEGVAYYGDWGAPTTYSDVRVTEATSGFLSARPAPTATPGRPTIWRTALRMFMRRPATGFGPGNTPVGWTDITGEPAPVVHGHSAPAELLATLGLVGTLPLVAFVSIMLRARVGATQSPATAAGLVVAVILVGSLADWTLATGAVSTMFWVALGAAAGGSQHRSTPQTSRDTDNDPGDQGSHHQLC